MTKPGSIYEINVKNFVTYKNVQLRPGQQLNMIIGANGSGKSTIVAAIILGLGGNPKTIGRGTKISEYVKHNSQEATVEIILHSDNPNEYITITRTFDVTDKTSWLLNNKKVSFKDIEKTIKQYNIQVDNLCQFLPQDRVQDFAKLNKQQLLQQTQIAICRADLLDKQLDLIKLREQHKEMQSSTEQRAQKLKELKDANLRIEGKVANLTKKKKFVKFIEDVDRKVAWIRYEKVRLELDEVKEDKKKITETLNKHRSALKPMETAIAKNKKLVTETQEKIAMANNSIRNHEAILKKKLETLVNFKSNITRIVGDLNSRLQEIKGRNQEIAKVEDEISKLTESRSEMLELNGNDNSTENALKSLNDEMRKITVRINQSVEKRGELENSKRNKSYELRCLESELANLENVKQHRLEWLRRVDKDAFTAVQWLRNNPDAFKGKVFEPMLLELNVLNSKHAIYVENTIPIRDRVAFTCVEKEDMNKLILILRDQKHLNVNVVHSGAEQPGLNRYQPVIPIEQLKPFGMFAYIRSLVTGPEPIMKYLCKTYKIHNTPVGDRLTNERFEKVPAEITNFFSDTSRFSTSYSRYTGQKSTRQIQIKSDGSFAVSVDTEQIENLRGQMGEIQQSCKKFEENISSLNNHLAQLNDSLSIIKDKIQTLKKRKQEIQSMESRLRILNNKLQQLQSNPVTQEQVEKEHQTEIKRTIGKMISEQSTVKEAFKKYSKIVLDPQLDKIDLEKCNRQITLLQNKSKDLQAICGRTEQTLNNIKTTYSNKMTEAKTLLNQAKQVSKGFTPDDQGFEEFRESYNNLPDNLAELHSEKEHTLSKIDCLSTADVEELEQYHNRVRLIDKYESEIQNADGNLHNINNNMISAQKEWLEPLEEIVQKINEKFSSAFDRMGCAGEVTIFKGEDDKDFKEYGLSIKVKYRDSEPLQELNSITQSGGERAVATAAYMLSLQELTSVPFRCVDEINQGMDENNERRIFELLVDATSGADTSQYFFITPKLIPNLRFVRGMVVHIVHNGCFIPPQKKWNNVISYVKQAILQK
ncbi:hypothetical protein RN001_000874 [Aquatica leii]|uniref:Structural maintenance of chromosomes protein 5 n=1 Tax=Aquatica leii TaxID=1421715 RepID=A0AAN7PFU2_9COLE|nr:hypothetical protein RN001_000874 [Aquatica leii]